LALGIAAHIHKQEATQRDRMEIYDKYKHLKKAEKEFLWAHPLAAADFNSNATAALGEAQKRFSSATLQQRIR